VANPEACNFDSFDGGSPTSVSVEGTPVAVASWQGRWFVQTREHAELVEIKLDSSIDPSLGSTIELGGKDIVSAGSSIFHASWNGVACASCHPEGREDGHTWLFDTSGARRTQTLSGGVMHKSPFHWRGELQTFNGLVNEVLVKRMEGGTFAGPDINEFGRWLDSIPAPPASPTGTPAQIAHGQQLFQDPSVGCAGCHTGEYFTTNQSQDVGTGAAFQVASLVGISARAPFFHDGCAATLQDRFDPAQAACNGGDQHGHTSQLSANDVGDLIAYLETL
jgi:mono/diheme cytochrome c family protein